MPKPEFNTSREEALKILKKGEYGVLCTASLDGQPYGVPLNYCYDSEKNCIYFHCSKTGLKLDRLIQNPKVSFVVVTRSDLVPAKLSTSYESIIATGRAAVVEDDEEVLHALVLLCEHLSPEMADKVANMNCLKHVCIVRVTIDDITGKSKDISSL